MFVAKIPLCKAQIQAAHRSAELLVAVVGCRPQVRALRHLGGCACSSIRVGFGKWGLQPSVWLVVLFVGGVGKSVDSRWA